jgi:hypothetical protein
MTASGLQRRIAQLEEAHLPLEPPPTWVRIIVHEGETEEEAMARHIAAHPEQPASTH